MDKLRLDARETANLNLARLCECREPLDGRTAKTLVAFLVSRCGAVDEQHVVAQTLVPEAKAGECALKNEFEGLSVGAIARSLKLDRHVSEGPEEHARTALQLIALLSNQFTKAQAPISPFANWRLYVRKQAHQQVRKGLLHMLPVAQLPEMACSPDMRSSRTDSTAASQYEQGASGVTALRLKDHLPPPEDSGCYHANTPQEVEKIFCTRISQGLTSVEVEERLADFGRNELPRAQPPSPLRLLLGQLDFMVLTMLVVLVVELALQKWAPAVLIFAVIAFEVSVGFVQELKAHRSLPAQVTTATVVRYGSVQVVDSRDVVPGDVVLLEEGCKVPADLRLVETAGLCVLEAVLTGESAGVEKSAGAIAGHSVALGDMANTAFMSTAVLRGRAKGIAVATGRHTEIGKISTALSSNKRSAIPEGLVAVITVAMAAGVKRMAAQNALVKHWATVEALGSVTTICLDKTGTLTQGRMVAAELRAPACSLAFPVAPVDEGAQVVGPDGASGPPAGGVWPPQLEAALMCCALCNNARVRRDDGVDGAEGGWVYTGDPTEGAIAVAAEKASRGRGHWESAGWAFVCEEPFDSDRKRMSVVYRDTQSGRHVLLAKGAPEAVLARCASSVTGALDMAAIDADASAMAGRAPEREQLEAEMTFAGFVGLVDPPRPEVVSAVAVCKGAGIKVCMITGDHPLTALAIAIQLGIAEAGNDKALMRGTDLEALPDEQALTAHDPFPTGGANTRMFARVSPEHKMKIVRALRSRHEVCVMTGDGANDAPALKESNIGVAMGKAGADLTKDAADVVLLDGNFRTIVMAVQEGRHIFDSIKRFVVFLVSCNLSEVVAMFLCAALGLEMPFLPTVILVVNLLEALPAMALVFEPHSRGLMSRKPRDPSKDILSRKAWTLIGLQGVSIGALVVLVYGLLLALEAPESAGKSSEGEETPEGLYRARGVALFTIVALHAVHSMLSRSLHNSVFSKSPLGNRWLLAAVAANVCAVCIIVFVPGIFDLFGLGVPRGVDVAKVVGCCVVYLAVVELYKAYLRCSRKGAARWYSEV
eukprot:m51a1_g11646 hypothetical protein (1052) ;mRNA; r:10246-16863